MSAFIVSKRHIDNMVATAQAYRMDEARDPTALGRMLWVENTRSVAYRYSENTEFPTYVDVAEAETYRFDAHHARPLTAVQALKAISCLEYQSCEHPTWEHSQAYEFCQGLRIEAITRLPGYDDAPWAWSAETHLEVVR